MLYLKSKPSRLQSHLILAFIPVPIEIGQTSLKQKGFDRVSRVGILRQVHKGPEFCVIEFVVQQFGAYKSIKLFSEKIVIFYLSIVIRVVTSSSSSA